MEGNEMWMSKPEWLQKKAPKNKVCSLLSLSPHGVSRAQVVRTDFQFQCSWFRVHHCERKFKVDDAVIHLKRYIRHVVFIAGIYGRFTLPPTRLEYIWYGGHHVGRLILDPMNVYFVVVLSRLEKVDSQERGPREGCRGWLKRWRGTLSSFSSWNQPVQFKCTFYWFLMCETSRKPLSN